MGRFEEPFDRRILRKLTLSESITTLTNQMWELVSSTPP